MAADGRQRVFVTRDLPGGAIARLADHVDVRVWPDRFPPPRADLLCEVGDVHGLLALLTDRVDAELLDAAPELAVVSNLAVGVDNIDVPELTARGIPLGHTPGLLTDATADLAWALMLAARRRVVEAATATKAGEWVTWDPVFMIGDSVAGQTLGIVGYGRIGRAVARRAQGFDMRVLVASRSQPEDADAVSLAQLLAQSDVVSLHCPLNAQTHHLIGAEELEAMKPTATLVNTSRGPVVDEAALIAALRNGVIASAGLDVVEEEPIALDNPLLSMPNCVVLPHIGSGTLETRSAMADLAADNLLAGLAGEPLPACFNPEVYGP